MVPTIKIVLIKARLRYSPETSVDLLQFTKNPTDQCHTNNARNVRTDHYKISIILHSSQSIDNETFQHETQAMANETTNRPIIRNEYHYSRLLRSTQVTHQMAVTYAQIKTTIYDCNRSEYNFILLFNFFCSSII